MNSPGRLESQFHEAMVGVYQRAKDEAGYKATRYIQMVSDLGGVEAARRLVGSDVPSDGYTKLWELGRLDITVEALISDHPEYHPLFSRSEIKHVRERLKSYGYAAAD
jgi:hypothetical protein